MNGFVGAWAGWAAAGAAGGAGGATAGVAAAAGGVGAGNCAAIGNGAADGGGGTEASQQVHPPYAPWPFALNTQQGQFMPQVAASQCRPCSQPSPWASERPLVDALRHAMARLFAMISCCDKAEGPAEPAAPGAAAARLLATFEVMLSTSSLEVGDMAVWGEPPSCVSVP